MEYSRRLKILILTLVSPYPANDGGKICVYGFIDYLRKYHDFTCLIPVETDLQYEQIEQLKLLWPEVSIIVADNRSIAPSAAAAATFEKKQTNLRIVRRAVGFVRRSLLKLLEYKPNGSENVFHAPIEYDMMQSADFSFPFAPVKKTYLTALTQHLSTTQYDIVQVELTRNLNLINVLPEGTIKIFEQIESRHDVIRDYLSTRGDDSDYVEYAVDTCEQLENYFISKYDAVLTLNKEDELYFHEKYPHLPVYTSPFGVLEKDLDGDHTNTKPTKLVFSGNGNHYPNYDALNWYLEEMHSEVYLRTGLKLYVTGLWPEDKIANFKESFSESVEFSGFVDNYNSFIKNSIMIVPMRLGGGGLRTKILYAMANGVPVVSTDIGIHGIEAEDKKHFLLANTKQEFSEAIYQYTDNNSFYIRISESSYQLFTKNYSQAVASERRAGLYRKLMDQFQSKF